MLRASFLAGMTTLTNSGFTGSSALSLSSDVEFRTRSAVTIGEIIQGSAATTPTTVSFTLRKLLFRNLAGAAFPLPL